MCLIIFLQIYLCEKPKSQTLLVCESVGCTLHRPNSHLMMLAQRHSSTPPVVLLPHKLTKRKIRQAHRCSLVRNNTPPLMMLALFLLSWISSTVSTVASKPVSSPAKPIVYTIAGSDSGGGAGIQADLHAIHALGGHGCSAITCLTAQNSIAVASVHAPPAQFLQEQLQALRSDLPPTAVKIGMLGTREIAVQVGDFLKQIKNNVWVVVDPVMISTSGHRLIEPDAQQAMVDHIFPHAHVLTPNIFEAEALLGGRKIETTKQIEQAARDLLQLGVKSVLIKGGHVETQQGKWAQDYFLSAASQEADTVPTELRLCDGVCGVWIRSPRYDTEHTHGTGCTLSSCIASALALGEKERSSSSERRGALSSISAVDACCLAKAYVTAGIHQGVKLGQGPGPVAQTEFPSLAEYYPSIVSDPTKASERPFRPMRSFDANHDKESPEDEVPMLGRILPIVDTIEWVEKICETRGVSDLQLRIKNESDPAQIRNKVQKAQSICRKAGVRLWVNDHWQAAIDAECFGVHVGQEDLYKCIGAGGLERLREKNMALGVSTHSFGELAAALSVKPSYISLGPVFATSSKKVSFDPQGLETVAKWRQLIPAPIPLVCIGGIVDDRAARAVCEAGADSVAVIGAITEAPNVQDAVDRLNSAMD